MIEVEQSINGLIPDAVRRRNGAMARRGNAGRKEKRGRKSRKFGAAAGRRGPTLEEKARLVFEHRHSLAKRRGELTEAGRSDRTRMPGYLPELATLRRLADRVYRLFDTPKDPHQARCRRSALVRDPAFRAVPELVKAMDQLGEEEFPRPMAPLSGPAGRRVRTNTHVGRSNRLFRSLEKVRHKRRRRRAPVRFVVLKLDEVWSHRVPPKSAGFKLEGSNRNRKTRPDAGQRPRRAA